MISGVHSPLSVGRRPSSSLSRLWGCQDWRSSASAPSPLDRCVYGDNSRRLAPSHIGCCACGDSSGPTPSSIGRCAWGDSCDPPLYVL